MDLTTRPVPTDSDGMALHKHTVVHSRNESGEATICGYWIDFATWKGAAEGAEPCPVCEDLYYSLVF